MRPYILSVDDEEDVTRLLVYNLGRAGFEVATAASGRLALDSIRCRRPDLLILDLMLPDIDGFGVCEILRRQPQTATIPVLILSAWSTSEAHNLGLELGALRYITKPFSTRRVVQEVEHLLAQRKNPATVA